MSETTDNRLVEAQLRGAVSGKKILLLEDEAVFSKPAINMLRRYGVDDIDLVTTGEAAIEAALNKSYDVLLLDRDNSGMDGLTALGAIRQGRGPSAEAVALMITRLGEAEQRIDGILRGADDYVVKPANELELMARIAAQLRRRPAAPQAEPAVQTRWVNGPLILDEKANTVTLFGEPLSLPSKDFAILSMMIQNTGLPLTMSMLFKRCWTNWKYLPDNWDIVYQRVLKLRRVLDLGSEAVPKNLRPIVVNVRGEGYMLRDLSATFMLMGRSGPRHRD
jgi:DNA-binding response OmpR family regulator